jgi:hypothetical protein
MEMAQLEQGLAEQSDNKAASQTHDLSDLQLALVGGGLGEVIVA